MLGKHVSYQRRQNIRDSEADDDRIRAVVDDLIKGSARDDYASISVLLGRNHAYIQQYVKRGTPQRLKKEDRYRIAQHFGVAPELLNAGTDPELDAGPDHAAPADELIWLPLLSPSGNQQTLAPDQETIAFSRAFLNQIIGSSDRGALALLTVDGDAMAPTLNPGDLAMVVRGIRPASLRDGVLALRINNRIVPRRISINPGSNPESPHVLISSDNPLYGSWHCTDINDLDILGRIVWSGRTL